ncbi:hypothetical protein ACFX5K_04155 [Rickettsiales bacterium LUAb2]
MLIRNIVLFSVTFLLCSCGMGYEKQSHTIKENITNNKNYKFDIAEDSTNSLLLNQEAGLFAFLQNNPDASLTYFSNATNSYRALEQSSSINVQKALAFTFLSDTLLKYEGSDYEKGLVHYYSGLDYLVKNNLDNAAIEFRAAEENQKFTEQLRQKQIIASEDKINSFLMSNNLKSPDIQQALSQSRDMRANTRNKFLNANILYVSGIVRELNGSPNDAYIDYKQAYALYPNNPVLMSDLYRLALNFDYDFANTLKKQNPTLANLNYSNYKQTKTVYLIYEQGFVPVKENLKISLIGVDSNLILSMNLPIYKAKFKPNNVSFDLNNNQNLVDTSLAYQDSNVYLLAKNQLLEDYPIIIARQIGKLASQIASQKALQNSRNGAPFGLALGLTSLFDSSDTRSWRLLPNTTQIAKINTQNNFNNATIKIANKEVTVPNLNLQSGQIAVVYVFDTGVTTYTKVLYKGNK